MKEPYHNDDYDLQTLLELDNCVYYRADGSWIKFSAQKVPVTEHIPHGVKYSLTLHDRYNKRIVGYDNAHDCLPKRRNHRAKKVKWDHFHKRNKVYYYEFDSASQLITDFFKTVDSA